jgi:DnaJ family protein C protein 7
MEFTGNVGGTFLSEAQMQAELKKESGNLLYMFKKYHEATALYTEAIELCPHSEYFGKRCACYMKLYQYELALKDARKAVTLDRRFAKGCIQAAKCSLALGDVTEAETAICGLRTLSFTNSALLEKVEKLNVIITVHKYVQKAYIAKDYENTLIWVDGASQNFPCKRYNLLKAECWAFLRQYQEAENIANDILHLDERNVEAIHMRGVCLYYQGKTQEAFDHFGRALHLAPNHEGIMYNYEIAKALLQKMEGANKACYEGRFSDDFILCSEDLQIDAMNNTTNTKQFLSKAMGYIRMGLLNDAVAECTNALDINKNDTNALLLRAKCYMDLEDFEKAVRDYNTAFEMDISPKTRRLLEDAELALKKSTHKDYYGILGVDRNASPDEIKKAYRNKALIHHPDRHVNAPEAKRKEHEKKFKEIGAAFATLSSPEMREHYDRKCTEGKCTGQGMEDLWSFIHKGSERQAYCTDEEFRFVNQFFAPYQ